MHTLKTSALMIGMLSLYSCGLFTPPSSPKSPETTPSPEFEAQGTPTVCTNQSAGGSFPYNSNGPLWRKHFFLNDNGTPLNYSTFSTDLPAVGNISMNPYVVNATGGTYTPQPWMYQYIYAPNVTLSGTQSTGAVANNVVTSVSGTYGLLYNNGLKQFELPIFSGTNTKFKLFDAAGNVLPTENAASQTYYPSINNGRVRIPTGQKVTLEFYLDPKVQHRKEMIWATFKDASGVSKTDWVTVNMPYQEGILKVNAATYTVQEPTGIKTYQSATNPLPKFKFVMRGYNNLVSTDRPFLSRQGIYYAWPSSVPSGNWTAYNQFMDERKDYVLNWNLYDQKVGSASVDASGNPVLNAATVSTPNQWNLGTPGYTNDKNCISKTIQVTGKQFSIQQMQLLDSSDMRIARIEVEPKNLLVPVGYRPVLQIKAYDTNGTEIGNLNPKEVTFSLVGRTDTLTHEKTNGIQFTQLTTVDAYHLKFTTVDQPQLVTYSYLSTGTPKPELRVLKSNQLIFPRSSIKPESITASNVETWTAPFTSEAYSQALQTAEPLLTVPLVLYDPAIKTGDHLLIPEENIAGVVTQITSKQGEYAIALIKPDLVPTEAFSTLKALPVTGLPQDDPSRYLKPQGANASNVERQAGSPWQCKGTYAPQFDLSDSELDLTGLTHLFNGSGQPAIVRGKFKVGVTVAPAKGGSISCEIPLTSNVPFVIPGAAGAFVSGQTSSKLKISGEIIASALAVGFLNTLTVEVDLSAPDGPSLKHHNDFRPQVSGTSPDFYSVDGMYIKGSTKLEAVLETTIDLQAFNQKYTRWINNWRVAKGLPLSDYLKLATMRMGPAVGVSGQVLSMNAVYNTGDSSQITVGASYKASFLRDLKWVDFLERAGIKLPLEFSIKLLEEKTQPQKISRVAVSPEVATTGNANVQLAWEGVNGLTPRVTTVQVGTNPKNSLHAQTLTKDGGPITFDFEACKKAGVLTGNLYASGEMSFFGKVLELNWPFNPNKTFHVDCVGAPLMEVNPNPIRIHGRTDYTASATITIKNKGSKPLHATLSSPSPLLKLSTTTLDVAANEGQKDNFELITLEYPCTQSLSTTLEIRNNSSTPVVQVPVAITCWPKDDGTVMVAANIETQKSEERTASVQVSPDTTQVTKTVRFVLRGALMLPDANGVFTPHPFTTKELAYTYTCNEWGAIPDFTCNSAGMTAADNLIAKMVTSWTNELAEEWKQKMGRPAITSFLCSGMCADWDGGWHIWARVFP